MRSSFVVKEVIISHDKNETIQHSLSDWDLLAIFEQHKCFYFPNCEKKVIFVQTNIIFYENLQF